MIDGKMVSSGKGTEKGIYHDDPNRDGREELP